MIYGIQSGYSHELRSQMSTSIFNINMYPFTCLYSKFNDVAFMCKPPENHFHCSIVFSLLRMLNLPWKLKYRQGWLVGWLWKMFHERMNLFEGKEKVGTAKWIQQLISAMKENIFSFFFFELWSDIWHRNLYVYIFCDISSFGLYIDINFFSQLTLGKIRYMPTSSPQLPAACSDLNWKRS